MLWEGVLIGNVLLLNWMVAGGAYRVLSSFVYPIPTMPWQRSLPSDYLPLSLSLSMVKSASCSSPYKLITGQQVIRCRNFPIDGSRSFRFIGSFHSSEMIPNLAIPDIAFLGRSNVGKSSLLNCLAGGNKPIAVESKLPGRTRAINIFSCSDSYGDICLFADLPGYGFAKKMSKAEQEKLSLVVHDYLKKRESLMLCAVLIDPRRGPMELDYELIKMLAVEGIPFVIVATKADKVRNLADVDLLINKIADAYGLPTNMFLSFSSSTGHGRKELWNVIRDSIQRTGPAYSLFS